MSLLTTGPPEYWWLSERSGRRVRSYLQSIPSYHGPHRIHPGMNNRSVEVAVLRRQSHPIVTNLPCLSDTIIVNPHLTAWLLNLIRQRQGASRDAMQHVSVTPQRDLDK
jgi:hypothetical protein